LKGENKMLQNMFRFTVCSLLIVIVFQTIIFAAPTEFTAQIYFKNSGEMVENLSQEDFQLFENLREQTISKVERETQPLSVVLIPMIGQGQYCDTSFLIVPNKPPSNKMTLIAEAFQSYLQPNDQFAMFLPNVNTGILRDFNASNDRVIRDFAEFSRISDISQNRIDENPTTLMSGETSSSEDIYFGVKTIFLEKAVDKSLKYLQTQTKAGNRQVIFFLRPFYNLTDLNDAKEDAFRRVITKQGTIFSWIGDDKEVFPHAPFQFYRKLPEMTGSEKQPCSLLKSKDAAKVRAVVETMLARLRTRYRITYSSNNEPTLDSLRQIKLELSKSGKRKVKKQTVITAPQIVFVQ
jgi:hypothetical protein